jgi:hypothetical protein
MTKIVFLNILLILSLNTGCESTDVAEDSDDETAVSGDIDVDVSPVTSGSWYEPGTDVTWQWQLKETLNMDYSVDIYDVDLYDTSAADISSLQSSGIKVICYFSAGSSENWRDDFSDFDSLDLGKTLEGWEEERWLDIRSANVQNIMKTRLDLAVTKGCDGVEPDNMDGYTNTPGFSFSANDQLAYNRFIANEAHNRSLSVGLKNSGDQADDLVDYFDFALNEQCHQFDECDQLAIFYSNDKPILNAEYTDDDDLNAAQTLETTVCESATTSNTRTLILPLGLDDSFRVACD